MNTRLTRLRFLTLLLIPLAYLAACSSGGGGNRQNGFNALLDEAQAVPAPVLGTRIRVTVTNTAPALGTFQTPVWIGFHDGTFDLYDVGASADTFFPTTNALERFAEDGNADPLTTAFMTSAAGDVQDLLVGQLGPVVGPIAPGETVSAIFELDPTGATNRYMSYASMVIPSNDAFVANGDPMGHEIFDGAGAFVATDFVVAGSAVLDAGTEVNDELPVNTAFFGQTTPDTGSVEGGLVGLHPGFLGVGMGGILDDPMFADADFTAVGYQVLSVTFEELPASSSSMGLATVELTSGGSSVDFSVAAAGLSGPAVGAHFHKGAPGAVGPILIDLTGSITENSDGNVRIEGSLPTTGEFRSALRSGNVYVNIHTDLNPTGELRGQLTTDDAFQGTLDTAQTVPASTLGTGVRVTAQNKAPDMGTFQTPIWIGFHDGTFEIYDVGLAASTFFPVTNALERLAEDGNTTQITNAFTAMSAGSIQAVVPGLLFGGPIQPGETVSCVFRLDPNDMESRYLSYATMVIPSNDAFVANGDPLEHEVFDGAGMFVGADFVVAGTDALDAGTEVNDEVPANTAFFGQMTPDTGLDQLGTVASHPGFLSPGMGGILDDAMFANADFTASGYEFLDVRLTETAAPVAASGLAVATLNASADEITFAINAHDLSGTVDAMHFHEGPVGVAGPVVVDLTSSIDANSDGQLTAAGSVAVDSAFVDALHSGNIYVNVHTALNPSGEIRGQVVLVD